MTHETTCEIDGTTMDLAAAREAVTACDLRAEIVPGGRAWRIRTAAGTGWMLELRDGRGAVERGADSDWGDWVGDVLHLDCGVHVDRAGREVAS